MKILSNCLVLLVALLHGVFLVLEMFLWTHPIGLSVFNQPLGQAQQSSVLAMNQGLYNGFLTAGLIWGWWRDRFDIQVFFLICVIVAGVFGALTASPTIIFVQALPAVVALLVTALANR